MSPPGVTIRWPSTVRPSFPLLEGADGDERALLLGVFQSPAADAHEASIVLGERFVSLFSRDE